MSTQCLNSKLLSFYEFYTGVFLRSVEYNFLRVFYFCNLI
jgi:hypothetical protein